MELLFIFILITAVVVANKIQFLRKRAIRRDYYRNDYLKSEAWQRKRYVVLKRDNWRCVYCGKHTG
jgi:predicted nucleotidyltransferase component of viral defense system